MMNKETITNTETNKKKVKIAVVGVGGAGNNAINNMIACSGEHSDITYIAANTDAQALEVNKAPHKVLLVPKDKRKEGLGAGAKPEVGQEAAENSIEEIIKLLEGHDICFIAAGLGGGTGTGAAPAIAKATKEMGLLTIAVVSKPFSYEGRVRMKNSTHGLSRLQESTDSYIVIPNDKISVMAGKELKFTQALKEADAILKDGVFGITDLIQFTGLVNLDFADVESVFKDSGAAHMGVGVHVTTHEDTNPVVKALTKAISSPLLETKINGARRLMVNFCSKEDLLMNDINEANEMIYDLVSEDVNFIFGTYIDENMSEGEIKITIIATDFCEEEIAKEAATQNAAQTVSNETVQATPEVAQQPVANTNVTAETNNSFVMPGEFNASQFTMQFAKYSRQ